jgi:hypothetical protein
MEPDLEAQLRELLAKQEIHERLMRYCRGVDRADAELITQAFWPDAMADHGHVFFTGDTIGDVLVQMAATHVNASSTHITGNELVEIEGDRAYTETYFLDFIERERDGVLMTMSRSARYVDRWERRDREWRIVHRRVVDSWNRVDPVVERWPTAAQFILAEHGRADPIFDVATVERRRPDGAVDGMQLIANMQAAGFAVRDGTH